MSEAKSITSAEEITATPPTAFDIEMALPQRREPLVDLPLTCLSKRVRLVALLMILPLLLLNIVLLANPPDDSPLTSGLMMAFTLISDLAFLSFAGWILCRPIHVDRQDLEPNNNATVQ